MPKMKRRLKIVEAIPLTGNPGQEKPILDEFLNMIGMKYDSLSVDNRFKQDNLRNDFLDKLLFERKDIRYRYIHISAHGNGDSLCLGSEQDCKITSDKVNTYKREPCKYPFSGSLITISACGSLLGRFAKALSNRGAVAVVRPSNEIDFPESAMFVILFYFMLGQRQIPERERGKKTSAERISEYIDVFQRTKISYLNIGSTGTWRLDYWVRQNGTPVHEYLF